MSAPQSSCEKRKNRTGEMEEENEGEGWEEGREKEEVGEQVGKEGERKGRMQIGNRTCTDGRKRTTEDGRELFNQPSK